VWVCSVFCFVSFSANVSLEDTHFYSVGVTTIRITCIMVVVHNWCLVTKVSAKISCAIFVCCFIATLVHAHYSLFKYLSRNIIWILQVLTVPHFLNFFTTLFSWVHVIFSTVSLTNCLQYNPSAEVNLCTVGEYFQIPLWNQKSHYHAHKSLHYSPIMIHVILVYIVIPSSFMILFNIILPSGSPNSPLPFRFFRFNFITPSLCSAC
jgi:hypothetical protein